MLDELRMAPEIVAEVIDHCERERPNEACGVLRLRGPEVVMVHPMENVEASPVRYAFESNAQKRVFDQVEESGLQAAVYHSHTRTPAEPSPTDVKRVGEVIPHVIVSLASKRPDIRAFYIVKATWTDDEGEISEIPVVVRGKDEAS